jgi:hypothetical protein
MAKLYFEKFKGVSQHLQHPNILIDYRICCAMSNLSMKFFDPDGTDSIEIAYYIRKRSKATENNLHSLLKMKFTPSVKYHCIQEINDFPKLTLTPFYKQVTFSSFKLRPCKCC